MQCGGGQLHVTDPGGEGTRVRVHRARQVRRQAVRKKKSRGLPQSERRRVGEARSSHGAIHGRLAVNEPSGNDRLLVCGRYDNKLVESVDVMEAHDMVSRRAGKIVDMLDISTSWLSVFY